MDTKNTTGTEQHAANAEKNQKALDELEAMAREILATPDGDTFLTTEGYELALNPENLCRAILAAMERW